MELWEHGLSLILSGGVFSVLFKFLLTKWLDDLKAMPAKLIDIELKINSITTKLEAFDKISEVVQEHDRDIILLKSKLHAYKR